MENQYLEPRTHQKSKALQSKVKEPLPTAPLSEELAETGTEKASVDNPSDDKERPSSMVEAAAVEFFEHRLSSSMVGNFEFSRGTKFNSKRWSDVRLNST